MPSSTPWCSAAGSFRLEWRPSRWLVGALALIAVLAPVAVLQSEMPRPFAWPVAIAALAWGAWRAWREARKPAQVLDWPVPDARVSWRGPILFLDAPGLHLSWWPDTLAPGMRKQLRRAMAP